MVISTANRSSALAVGALLSIGVGSIAAAYYWKLSNQEEYSKAILTLIKRRRSIFPKQFSGEPVDRKILEEMLEAARWAPTHNVTQPWKFVVFSSHQSKAGLGSFLANLYKEACATRGWTFSEAKYKKYDSKVQKASFVVALLCDFGQGKNPPFEEICSVAMAVQNMHLVATAHGVGAYWSSAAVYSNAEESSSSQVVVNPRPTREFLELSDSEVCLGWMFVGGCDAKKWPQGRRKELENSGRLRWT